MQYQVQLEACMSYKAFQGKEAHGQVDTLFNTTARAFKGPFPTTRVVLPTLKVGQAFLSCPQDTNPPDQTWADLTEK